MANDVILQKLDSLARCLERLKTKMPRNITELKNDIDCQDIIILNLERSVQLAVDIALTVISQKKLKPIPSTMTESFEVLKKNKIISEPIKKSLQKAVGFRNIAVHEYDKINWDIVYAILKSHLKDFKSFAKTIEKLKS